MPRFLAPVLILQIIYQFRSRVAAAVRVGVLPNG